MGEKEDFKGKHCHMCYIQCSLHKTCFIRRVSKISHGDFWIFLDFMDFFAWTLNSLLFKNSHLCAGSLIVVLLRRKDEDMTQIT